MSCGSRLASRNREVGEERFDGCDRHKTPAPDRHCLELLVDNQPIKRRAANTENPSSLDDRYQSRRLLLAGGRNVRHGRPRRICRSASGTSDMMADTREVLTKLYGFVLRRKGSRFLRKFVQRDPNVV